MSSEHAPQSEIVAGNLLRSPDTCFQVNHHIGLLFGERLNTILRHRIRKYPDSPVHMLSDSLRINFFHSGERIYFFPDLLSNSPNTCGQ